MAIASHVQECVCDGSLQSSTTGFDSICEPVVEHHGIPPVRMPLL